MRWWRRAIVPSGSLAIASAGRGSDLVACSIGTRQIRRELRGEPSPRTGRMVPRTGAAILVMVVLWSLGVVHPAWASAGALDPSFGNGGIVVPPAPQIPQSMHVQEVAVLSSGTAIAVGWTQPWPGDPRPFVNVVSADGSVSIPRDQPTWDGASALLAAAATSEDRVIVAGWARSRSASGSPTPERFFVARLLPDGELDRSYGVDGLRVTSMGGLADVATGVAVDAAGRAVVVGRTTTGTSSIIVLARYMPGGRLDPTFGSSGRASVRFVAGTPVEPAIAIGPRGGLVVASTLVGRSGAESLAVARLTADGRRDPSFSDDGKAVIRFASPPSDDVDLVVQQDGRIVIGLTLFLPAGSSFALVRLLGDGTRDATFGGRGRVIARFGPGDDELHSIAIQTDGMILAGGGVRPGPAASSMSSFGLARFHSAGQLDPTFGSGGVVTTSIVPANDWIMSLALLTDGRILAAGRAVDPDAGEPVFARYLGTR